MKALPKFIIILILFTGSAASFAAAPPSPTLEQALKELTLDTPPTYGDRGIPNALFGNLAPRAKGDVGAAAVAAMDALGSLFDRTGNDSFEVLEVLKGEGENVHVRLSHRYKGLPVIASELIVHMDASTITGINGDFAAHLQLDSTAK